MSFKIKNCSMSIQIKALDNYKLNKYHLFIIKLADK